MAKKARPGPSLAGLLPSWIRSLDERDLSKRTQEVYLRTGEQFTRWLAENDLPTDTEGIDAPHIRAFLASETKRTSAVSAHQHYRNLRVLFKWLAKEGERLAPDPMFRVDPPKVTRKVKPILASDDIDKLLRTCTGQDFESRRDAAILSILIDTGVRVSGLGNMRLDDVNLHNKVIRVVLKGGDEHWIPLGKKSRTGCGWAWPAGIPPISARLASRTCLSAAGRRPGSGRLHRMRSGAPRRTACSPSGIRRWKWRT
jgi:site-specific recombinase XerD